MVSQKPPSSRRGSASRERLLAAAAVEFAARGFDGAKVDRIARRARVNKAMVYYHFPSKAALYREILDRVFRTLAGAVAAEQQAGGDPEDQLRRFVRAVAAQIAAHPHLPAIWLREMAEGGRHLDPGTVRELAAILATLDRVLTAGRRAGVFVSAHPLVTQMTIVAPLLLFAASAPLRERARAASPVFAPIDRAAVIAHVEATALAALSPPGGGRRTPRRAAVRRSPR